LRNHISNPLNFFLETQFAFASLIESDKRDAGNNKEFNRERFGKSFRANFTDRLNEQFAKFQEVSALNMVRTRMRHDAVESIKPKLEKGERVFTLSAPTGAGKTMMLLSLAAEILRRDAGLSIIYALPFLAITEQVEAICKTIFHTDENAVLRLDSKSENERVDKLQKKIDASPSDESLRELLQESFSDNTFDHPFIITTFVQVFEALVSNRNSTLLRLPNFARTIFLIDEIQALPPRLYTFFTALLDEFCRKFDSYAIISTATMPYFEMPQKEYLPDDEKPHLLFKQYRKPGELLEGGAYYNCAEFNRYRVKWLERTDFRIEDLANEVQGQPNSCLVILNTIDDTKKLYELLSERIDENCFAEEHILLNTHFTLNDRRAKIDYCKQRLNDDKRIILISTQLIEAGVDIDFPILYRDMCPLPNLIQSAGRCNRNGAYPMGTVFLFELKKENGKSSASLIYRDEGRDFLTFCKTRIAGSINEAQMLGIQREFFEYVGNNLQFGLHKQSGSNLDMVKCINHASFETLGTFQLIDDEYFGDEFRYYIPQDTYDCEFEKLSGLANATRGRAKNYAEAKQRELQIESQMRRMSGDIVTIRISAHSQSSAPQFSYDETMGIRKLADLDDYSSATGIRINGVGGFII
jgi:CRISPR-associated endonuclease/helicase Cas3